MFGINDNVVHKNAGVCIVSDIVIKDFGNGKQTYYFLKPKFPSIANKSLEIFLPLEKESVMIRRPMNKDEALRRQSRPGAQNGRAVPVKVYNEKHEFVREFSYIGEACDYLIEIGATNSSKDNIRGGIWKANKKRSLYLKHYFEY